MSFKEWKQYKLGDFSEIQNGYAFKANDFTDAGIPVIKIKNIASSQIHFNDVQYYGGEISERLKQFLIKKNDVLISMTGSNVNQMASAVGKVGKYQFNYPALLNQRVGKVYIKNSNLGDPDFLYYFLNRFETQFELASSAGGSANQANISPTQIKNLRIFLPPITTQRKIASVLSSLDDKIELNRQTNQTLEAIAQTLFKEWFVYFNFPGATGEMLESELGEIPKGWKVGTVGDLFELQRGFDLPSTTRLAGNIPVIAASGFNGFHNEYKIKAPGITTGRSGVLGNVFYIQENFWPLNTSLFIKQFKLATPLFSYFILQNIDLKGMNGGSAVPTLNRNEVHKVKVIIPAKEFIVKFEKVSLPLFQLIKGNEEQIRTLTKLRDDLLPKLMKGQISL